MKPKTSPLSYLHDDLEALRTAGLLRTRHPSPAGSIPSFCSNDYLGLALLPSPQDIPTGSAGSRLLAGDNPDHTSLESALATWLEAPAVLTYTSGWAANTGLLPALARQGDLIVSDALNHASTVDACRLSKATVRVIPHLDLGALRTALQAPRAGRAFVTTESYFSMDADTPDLSALRSLCDEHDAVLIVDEAHALGLFGPDGRGLCADVNVVPDALVGTFGKSFGGAGAFVAGSPPLIDWLYNRSRPFVFSTGISPIVAAAAERALRTSVAQPELRRRTLENADYFRQLLTAAGIEPMGHGPIIPVLLGTPERAIQVAQSLRSNGVIAHPVRPPTVPVGTARLRLTVTALHTRDQIAFAFDALQRALRTRP